MLKSIEGYNADRVIELPRHQIGDDRFEVGPLDFGLAVNAAQLAKAVDYEVDGLICAVPHERQGRACFWHTRQLPTQSVREFKHETGNRSCPKVMLRGLQPAGLHPPARSNTAGRRRRLSIWWRKRHRSLGSFRRPQ
jgi:hypothetical protein